MYSFIVYHFKKILFAWLIVYHFKKFYLLGWISKI